MMSPHVLVVEDDPALAESMALLLCCLDVSTAVTGSGREALAHAAERPCDVAVLDLCLPDQDGLTLLSKLRERSPDTEGVIVTGHASVESAARAVRERAADYVLKPFEPARLLTGVRSALTRRFAPRAGCGARLREHQLTAVGTLARGLAHELRNPLNSAILQVALAARRVPPQLAASEAEPFLGSLARADAELRRLARVLGDFEQCITPTPPSRRRASVARLCRLLVREIRDHPAAAGLVIHADIEPALPSLPISPDAVRDALRQLVRNALEAMQGEGTLTLRARKAWESVELEVEDTGPGVADERSIFDPFYSTKPSGTGLGLTLVQRTAMDHGGSLRLSSRPGRTCFTLVLPNPSQQR